MKQHRILHVLGGLEAGGVETWLFNIVQNFDLDKYQMDFMIFSGSDGVYGDALRSKGCQIYYAPKTKNIFKVASFYINTVKKGKYTIVHTHRHFLCGLYLIYNKFTNAKFIAHSHNTFTDSKIFRNKIIAAIFKSIVKKSPNKLSCTPDAGMALFGEPGTVILYGIDTNKFVPTPTRLPLLNNLYKPAVEDIVIGHVGRFTEQKNHHFLLDIAKILIAKNSNYHIVLIGEGVLHNEIEARIKNEGLANNVHLAGVRKDVNDFMRGFFDIFLFPSLYEGFGIVLIEAQCAALPVVFSKNLPENVDTIPELIYRIDVSEKANTWADKIISVKPVTAKEKVEYHEFFKTSVYSISYSSEKLKLVYDNIN